MRSPLDSKTPPGLERKILRKLPHATLASALIPALFYLFVKFVYPLPAGAMEEKLLMSAAIVAIAVSLTLLTAIFTLAIGCWIVVIMKGPAKYADSYQLQDAERPNPKHEEENGTYTFKP